METRVKINTLSTRVTTCAGGFNLGLRSVPLCPAMLKGSFGGLFISIPLSLHYPITVWHFNRVWIFRLYQIVWLSNMGMLLPSVSLLAYDTLLTLPSEITYIWHRGVRLGSVLYLVARYPSLLGFIITACLVVANMPLKCVRPIGSSPKLYRHRDSSRCRRTFIGASICHVPAQSRDAVGAWGLGSSSVYGYFGCGCICRCQRRMQRSSGSGCSTFVTETINNVFLILFDTLVIVVTLYNTLGLVRRSREFPMLSRTSLTQTLAEQGLIRYGFILTITLAGGIIMKVLRPSIAGILLSVQDSLSVIVICRCHLALLERVAHPNGTTAHHPITSFRAAAQQIHNSLVEEFGDPSVSETGISESQKLDDASCMAVAGIELDESPHGKELGSAVDAPSREVSAAPQTVAASTGEVSIEA
ncbi:hypothetical protein JB92DRAFT_1515042 [Gautieria morchelliformis]|nr:hypothetical protein JB92DRAFT_1515042 [Gautieria morchelliformis]